MAAASQLLCAFLGILIFGGTLPPPAVAVSKRGAVGTIINAIFGTTTPPPTRAAPPPVPLYCDRTFQAPGSNVMPAYPSRVFPVCVGKDPETKQYDPILHTMGWDKILDDLFDQNVRDQHLKGFSGFVYDWKKHHQMRFAPNTIPAQLNVGLEFHQLRHYYNPQQNKYKIMENWLVVDVHGAGYTGSGIKAIHGVYMQAIQGPFGLPFGEFVRLKHGFREDQRPNPKAATMPKAPAAFIDNAVIYPCTFYPKAGPTIPSVYLWSKDYPRGSNELVYSRFNVTFTWTDSLCMEVSFFQFLVIVVYNFQTPEYVPFLTSVVCPWLMRWQSTTGLAYPYYPDWGTDEVRTYRTVDDVHLTYTTNAQVDYRSHRIVSNLDYEHCVTHGVRLDTKGSAKGACPPGPFQCGSGPTGQTVDQFFDNKRAKWFKWLPIYLKYDPLKKSCHPVAPPTAPPPPTTTTTSTASPSTTLGTVTSSTDHGGSTDLPTTAGSTTTTTTTTEEPLPPTPSTTQAPPTDNEKQEAVKSETAKKTEKKKVISHGDLCVFIWLVLVPVANYLARFFKDFPNWACLGIGFWIVGHVVIHHLGVLLMWISFGLVVSNGVSFLGGATGAHYLFGFPATFIQHYGLFTGFHRDPKLQPANRQSIVHAVIGYLSGFLSLLCSYNSRMTNFRWYMVVSLFGVSGMASCLGTFVEYRIAKRLTIYPPRKLFPVVERLMMVNVAPYYSKLRIFVAILYILLISVVYTAYLFDEIEKGEVF